MATSRDKVRDHRARMRARGMKLVQMWVPDTRSPAFRAEALRQSRLVASSPHEGGGSGVPRLDLGILVARAKVKRGEIWTSAGGPNYAGKPRPALIVQDDAFEGTDSVTVCLLTSHDEDAPLLRPPIDPTAESGLREAAWAMVDKIATVPRARLGRRIGALAPAAMRPVNQAMLVFLGLAGR